MLKYKVVKRYSKWDSTLKKGNAEIVEYPVHHGYLSTLKDARGVLEATAMRETMHIFDGNMSAVKGEESTDEETGITTIELEELYIDIQK